MSIKKDLRKFAGKVKRKLFKSIDRRKIIDFKKEIWQTDKLSAAFIKGSDPGLVSLADVMDREVNVFFLENCAAHNKILDIGCGHGIVSEYLALNGMDVTAIDISEKLLDEFKTRINDKNLSINILQGDAYNIPCENDAFDVVVARMFLPHFPDWPVVLKEMTRVTKKGGKLLIHFPSKENTDLGKKIGTHDCQFSSAQDTNDPWRFYAETDAKELNRIARSIGVRVVKRTPVSFFVNNKIIGHQLGQKLFDQYQKELNEKLVDERVKEFVVWFDNIVSANSSPGISYLNVITFEKEK